MAENKKAFVLYCDLRESLEHLSVEEKGLLFNHILDYVNDLNPVLTDRLLLTAWKPIELQLKRDLDKYKDTIEQNSINGRVGNLKRWYYDLYEKYRAGALTLEAAEAIANSRKASPPDRPQSPPDFSSSPPIAKIADTDTDTDTDTEKDIFLEADFSRAPLSTKTKDFSFSHEEPEKPKPKKPKSYKQWKKEDFYNDVRPFIEKYGRETCNKFYKYWTEPSPEGKMRFQLEKTWLTRGRLDTWKSNESKFESPKVSLIPERKPSFRGPFDV